MSQKLEFILFFLILSLYFILRLSFLDTIEFGYDQPLLTNQIISFLQNPTFINAQNYVTENPWGYPSWGPMQIFFYSPFVSISKNPILISILIIIFNSISIIAIYLIGKILISPKAGLLASILLATNPWWLIFSRMIYQPTPIVTLLTLCIILSIYLYKNPKSKLFFLLLISWTVLFQVYVHTVSFIIPSFILIFNKINKTKIISSILGIILALLLFLPVFRYYLQNTNKLSGIKKVEQTFNNLYSSPTESLMVIVGNFATIISGGGWQWQLGYGEIDFYKTNKALYLMHLSALFLTLFYFIAYIILIFKQKNKILYILILLWMLGPVWFLFLIKSPIALPRYFLISLPPLVLIISFVTNKLSNIKTKNQKWLANGAYLGPLFITLIWIWTNLTYYRFVSNYNYNQGFLSNYSDVPYIFVQNSLNWIFNDVKQNNYQYFTISNNEENANIYDLNAATRYTLENVYHYQYSEEKKAKVHYIMAFKPISLDLVHLAQFGPYVIMKIDNSK